MNAIQQFAQKYGKVVGNDLARKYDDIAPEFTKAVSAVVGDKCSVGNGFNDSRSDDFNEWSVILDDIEGKNPGTEIVLVLNTDLGDGKSWLECHCYDDDANLLNKVEGEVGEFDPLPLIDKVLKKGESKKSEAAEVKDKKYYQDMFDAAYKECCQLAIEDGKSEEDWADYFSDIKTDGPFKQKEADEIVGYYMEFHPESDSEPDRPYRDWLENIEGIKHTPLDNEITRILKALYAPNESKKHVCSMQKKKESLLAKKNESDVSLPKDVEDAMRKVRAYLRGNYASIEGSGLVSDADCSVGYQLDNALNVLDDIVANFPKG
ncbi:MAG: hypothetical protein IKT27_03835 [Clostridia bacterium]|nr:hypothetical protein [Clostridia bacterium]